jgi:MerR family transcriptional regulator, thiopeptide resistance regulator
MADGITISQAAAFAGVTVKTIRHYHRLGLVEEPGRDQSGYRRYGSADLLRLVQVRTLAGAGVALAEIAAILDADSVRFATALASAEQRLTSRIDELVARREMLRRLAGGDRALLPDRACTLLDRIGDLGFSPGDVALTQEALVLVRVLVPESFENYLTLIERSLDDPHYVSLIKRWSGAGDWAPDDPRVDELATEWGDYLLAHPELVPVLPGLKARDDGATRNELLSHHGEQGKPAWARMTTLIEARLRAAGIDFAIQDPAG